MSKQCLILMLISLVIQVNGVANNKFLGLNDTQLAIIIVLVVFCGFFCLAIILMLCHLGYTCLCGKHEPTDDELNGLNERNSMSKRSSELAIDGNKRGKFGDLDSSLSLKLHVSEMSLNSAELTDPLKDKDLKSPQKTNKPSIEKFFEDKHKKKCKFQG